MVTAGDTVPDDGEYGLRILHQKWPHMMIDMMDLFMGEGSDQSRGRSRAVMIGGRERLCECSFVEEKRRGGPVYGKM